MNHQQVFLGSCMLDPSLINYGVLHGLKPSAFTSLEGKAIWMQLLDNRTNNRLTDMQSLYLDMGTNVPAADLMACEQLAPTSAYGKKALTVILEAAVVKNIRPALNDALSLIDDGEPYSRVKTAVEGLNDLLRIEEVIEAGNDRKKAHGRARRKRPAKPPARAPKISVSRAARRPPPTNSR